MKFIYTLALVLFTQLSFSQQLPEALADLDNKINELIAQHEAVGLAVAVVKDDKVIYFKGFGYRNLNERFQRGFQPGISCEIC